MIKKIILLLVLFGYLGTAIGAVGFAGSANTEPCPNHIESVEDDIDQSKLSACDKHCASTVMVFLGEHSFAPQKFVSRVQHKLNIPFSSLDILINLPPPK